jgi:Trk-type K+ transport system membrane component
VVSKIILMVLMFFGRGGALTLIYAAVGNKSHSDYDYPLTQISVG